MPRPRHLLRFKSEKGAESACGLRNPKSWTQNPASVSCMTCQRTLLMADAEVITSTIPRNQRTQPRFRPSKGRNQP